MCIQLIESLPMTSKDVGIRIRIEKELRDSFQGACDVENRSASEVLRDFMRSFAEQRVGGMQPSLFPKTEVTDKPRKARRLSASTGHRNS